MKNIAFSIARRLRRIQPVTWVMVAGVAVFVAVGCAGNGTSPPGIDTSVADLTTGAYVVLGYNDLGMHCMNQDFSELCVLPPANTLRAQVIRRGEEPQIVTSGVQVQYSIPGNTRSSNKTNFWQYVKPLFGASPATDVGLFGFGLSGNMKATLDRDFIAQGIPLTQITDAGTDDAYQLSRINVVQSGKQVATTQAVAPVSWEMSCNRCHNTPGVSVATDILMRHDKLHGTKLVNQKPVLCAKCHADPALGAPGVAGVPALSTSMHSAHANRMRNLTGDNACYSCHPGPKTQCFRDVHKAKGLTCNSCHTSMKAVGSPTRTPWVDEPRCGSCHQVKGHQYEQPGVLFRNSVGHNGVKCIACHGSPHAITPTLNPRDNVQAIALQGTAGVISKCTVCHTKTPSERFNHTRSD